VRGGRVDRGERTLDRHRLAVAAHGAAGPRVGLAVAERLGDLPRRPVLRQLTLDLLALGVGELDIGDGAPGDRHRYRITWGDVVGAGLRLEDDLGRRVRLLRPLRAVAVACGSGT